MLEIHGEFAKVSWNAAAHRTLVINMMSEEAALPPLPSVPVQESSGYVAWAYLSAEEPNAHALLSHGIDLETAGRYPEATDALERAAWLLPSHGGVLRRLARCATLAERYRVAVSAGLRLTQVQDVPAASSVLLGCRGSPLDAEVFASTSEVPEGATAACVTEPDIPRSCEPCGIPNSPSEEFEQDIEMRREAAHREQEEYDESSRRVEEARDAIKTRFPNGAWVHIRVPSDEKRGTFTAYFYSMRMKLRHSCGSYSLNGQTGEVTLSPPLRIRERTSVDIWVRVPDESDQLYGLVATHDGVLARSFVVNMVQKMHVDTFEGAIASLPRGSAHTVRKACGCCGC
ncbi:MAG: hypothetical protein AB2A00_31465 [Myxococcota bacterium]